MSIKLHLSSKTIDTEKIEDSVKAMLLSIGENPDREGLLETPARVAKSFSKLFGGYLEDPATGSGNSAFGYYLMIHDMWGGEMIRIEQNGFRDTPNFIQLFSKQNDQADSRVWFGGGAVMKIEGQYILS